MWELLNNAWNGWGNFIFYGKYPALLLLVLVVFWFFSDRKREPVLLGYTTVMTVCCIFPLTAALLMQYQTKFYDYQWVWNYVPLLIVVAFAGTLVLGYCRKWAAALVMLVIILLCGRLTDPLAEVKTDWQQTAVAEKVVTAIAEAETEEPIMLWAPKEVMAAARVYAPGIKLPYGRDLWDASLGAYTYDTYTQVEDDLCQWMHCAGVFGTVDGYRLDGTVLEGRVCVEQALELDVNCIVVPAVMTQEAIAELTAILEEKLGQADGQAAGEDRSVQMQPLEAYYIFTWN